MRTESLAQTICDVSLRFGENSSSDLGPIISRPFGVALLIAGCDDEGVHLYCADPSGTFMKYSAKAIGSGAEVAQSQLQEEYKKDISLEEALKLAAKVLSQVMEDKINHRNAQIAVIAPNIGFKLLGVEEMSQLISPL